MWTPRQDTGWDLMEEAFCWVENLQVATIAHGVGFPVGGCEPPDTAGVALAAFSAQRLTAAHWSEHLSFNRATVGGRSIDAGFLLPPAQTWAGVDAAADHVATYRAAATLPFLIETGVNYLRPRPGELSDGAFVAAVADRGDCAILLDLHNLLANERNGREPVRDVLSELPLERVLEVHVAGGFEFDGYYLDAHIGGPDGELLALLAEVLPRLPNVRAVTFEAVPESLAALGASGVRSVLEALHRVVEGGHPDGVWRSGRHYLAGALDRPVPQGTRCGPRPGLAAGPADRQPTSAGYERQPSRPVSSSPAPDVRATRDWERRIAAYTSRITNDPPGADPGLGLLRHLADQARLGQLLLARPDLIRSLAATLGLDRTEQTLHRYLRARPPQRWTVRESAQFASWLAEDDSGTKRGRLRYAASGMGPVPAEAPVEVATGYAGIRTRCAVLAGQRSVGSRLRAWCGRLRWGGCGRGQCRGGRGRASRRRQQGRCVLGSYAGTAWVESGSVSGSARCASPGGGGVRSRCQSPKRRMVCLINGLMVARSSASTRCPPQARGDAPVVPDLWPPYVLQWRRRQCALINEVAVPARRGGQAPGDAAWFGPGGF